ncbi:hypothetical protein DPMN_075196 [Dreissena polymorpha]|uniref:Uncharacterized protein n=1 Tax=Dreissena polymorpha TaxID=45954 RepID=A0A9D3YK17_DREPO|nr:hypothetical protein DPMN_075196 [Dreissena polymorpha]
MKIEWQIGPFIWQTRTGKGTGDPQKGTEITAGFPAHLSGPVIKRHSYNHQPCRHSVSTKTLLAKS